jgi:hypothetical protein
MKNVLVILAGLLLTVSLLFPNGFTLPGTTPVVTGPTDPVIVKILQNADAADRARIDGIYSGLAYVIKRDNGKLITTTDKWATVQANTLDTAVEKVGEYPGLDKAINDVFVNTLGTLDVLPGNPEVQQKLVDACGIIANSARVQ